jgi:hypothetical protein
MLHARLHITSHERGNPDHNRHEPGAWTITGDLTVGVTSDHMRVSTKNQRSHTRRWHAVQAQVLVPEVPSLVSTIWGPREVTLDQNFSNFVSSSSSKPSRNLKGSLSLLVFGSIPCARGSMTCFSFDSPFIFLWIHAQSLVISNYGANSFLDSFFVEVVQ